MIKPILKFLIVIFAAILTSCGGGKCASCITPTPTPSGVPVLSVASPTQFPAHQANTAYLTVSNTSNFAAKNLTYSIGTNNTNGTISIVNSSAIGCANIGANDTCILQVSIGADANPGSFTILVDQPSATQSMLSVIKQKIGLNSTTQTLTVNIGLLDLPVNTDSGANGITLLFPSVVTANPDGSTQVIITAVVNSATSGVFNTINLTTSNGTLLNFSVLSGNSGNGMGDLGQGSVVSLLVTIPANATQLPIYIQTAKNSSVVSQGTVQNLIQTASSNVGILSVSPSNTTVNSGYTSQIFTLVNTGLGTISNLNVTLSSSILTTSSNSCGNSLAAGASCTYTVNFDATQVVSGTANITTNYNNGQTNVSATATINYNGTNPTSGLTIASGENPNFNFATTTNTSQATQITIKNTGNTSENNIIFTVPQYFSLTAGNSSSCTLSGATTISDTLAPDQSCNLTLTYNNNSPTSGTPTAQFIANYNYDSSLSGTPVSVGLTYSTTQATAILRITPVSYTFPNISADNIATITYEFTVTNVGDHIATSVSSGITGTNASLFTPINIGANDCSNFATLLANETCKVTVQVGPTSTVIAGAMANLNINYIPYTGQSPLVDTAALTVTTIAPPQPNISVQSITLSPNATSGNGSDSPNQWQIAQNTSAQTMTITYVNTGNADAGNFSVDTSSLSSGYTLSSNSCSSNFTLQTNSGNTCQVVLSISTSTPAEQDLLLTNLTSTWTGQSTPQSTTWVNPSTSSSQTSVFVNLYPVTPVTILQTQPTNNSIVQAAATSSIVITFSEDMDATTINPTNISLIQQGVITNILSGCSGSGVVFSCSISSALTTNATYVLNITTGVVALSGDRLLSNYTSSFSTNGLIGCQAEWCVNIR